MVHAFTLISFCIKSAVVCATIKDRAKIFVLFPHAQRSPRRILYTANLNFVKTIIMKKAITTSLSQVCFSG